MLKLPKLNPIDGRIILQDVYETHYGIYNHLQQSSQRRPLASVAMHTCEDVNTNSQLETVLRSYHTRGVKDLFGLSIIEFLELPMDVVDMLFTICSEIQASKSSTLNQVEEKFKL